MEIMTKILLMSFACWMCDRETISASPLDLRARVDSATQEGHGHRGERMPRREPLYVDYDLHSKCITFEGRSMCFVAYRIEQEAGDIILSDELWLSPNVKSVVCLNGHGPDFGHCRLYIRIDNVVYESDFIK